MDDFTLGIVLFGGAVFGLGFLVGIVTMRTKA